MSYLLVEHVAARYGVTPDTVREWARAESLPHLKRPGARRLLFLECELDDADRGGELVAEALPRGGRRVKVKRGTAPPPAVV
jgi:hypothetical protein